MKWLSSIPGSLRVVAFTHSCCAQYTGTDSWTLFRIAVKLHLFIRLPFSHFQLIQIVSLLVLVISLSVLTIQQIH